MERDILIKLDQAINKRNLILPEQFDFSKGHSTTHQLARVLTDIKDAWNRNEIAHLALLNI